MSAKSVKLENVTKQFTDDEGKTMTAVNDVSLHIEKGEFATLLELASDAEKQLHCV